MKLVIKWKSFFSIVCVLFVFIYCILFPYTRLLSQVDAVLVLIFSIVFLIKSRNSLKLFIIAFFIFYANYSIVFGEYIIGSTMVPPWTEVRTQYFYGLGIRGLLLFMIIFSLFVCVKKEKSLPVCQKELIPKNNILLFTVSIIMLILAFTFGFKRGPIQTYEVRITPFYEYSKLLFLLAFYYSGNSKSRKLLIIFLIIMFIVNDALYGGRATSVQLAILLAITIFYQSLTPMKILFLSIPAILYGSVIGALRQSFLLGNISISNIIHSTFNSWFVSDTFTYAYYASITHIASHPKAGLDVTVRNMLQNFGAYFIGSRFVGADVDVTRFVRQNYYFNLGGGLMFSHFYFWLGWLGVVIFTALVVYVINRSFNSQTSLGKLVSYAITINVPRWYTYSPNQFFRGSIILVILLFLFFSLLENEVNFTHNKIHLKNNLSRNKAI